MDVAMRMMRNLGSLVAVFLLIAADRMSDSALASALRYAALTYMFGAFALQVHSGYVRRRPHWTAESWRRFLLAASVPVGAVMLAFGIMFALEAKIPIVGEPRSFLRSLWIIGIFVFLLFGAVGSAFALHWLAEGDASRQFGLPRWLRRRGPESA
jgi:hypothetical protein